MNAGAKIGSGSIQLVDEDHASAAPSLGLLPDSLRLGFNSSHSIKHDEDRIHDSHATSNFRSEVDVARRVQDLQSRVTPPHPDRGALDRNASSLLLRQPVRRRRAVIDGTLSPSGTSFEEDSLGQGGLAGIHVRHDS
jgi:hypothetical protein